jgi:hypothetical protein
MYSSLPGDVAALTVRLHLLFLLALALLLLSRPRCCCCGCCCPARAAAGAAAALFLQVVYGHLDDPEHQELQRGVSYLKLRPGECGSMDFCLSFRVCVYVPRR